MTTELEVTSDKTMPQNDAIKYSDIGDHFDLDQGSGDYIVTSKIFLSNWKPISSFPSEITIKLILERTGSPAYELHSSLIITHPTRPPALVGDIFMYPGNTLKLSHKSFDIRANGLFFPTMRFTNLSEGMVASTPEDQIDSITDDDTWVSKNQSIKLSNPGNTYHLFDPGVPPKPPTYTVASKKFISIKNDESEWLIETILKAAEHPDIYLESNIEPRLSILPYAKSGDTVLTNDTLYKATYKTFARSPSSQLYSVSLGLQTI
ncbi:hypothetical protein D3C84_386980 [compost metagenome]